MKIFADLYLAKFLDSLAKLFFLQFYCNIYSKNVIFFYKQFNQIFILQKIISKFES